MSVDVQRPVRLVKTLSLFHGREWLSWTPEVVQLTLIRKFGYTPDEADANRIEALRETLRSDNFLSSPLLFEKLVRSFCGEPFTESTWEPVTASELAFGLYVIGQIAGRERAGAASESVRAYIGTCLSEDGVVFGPAELGFDIAETETRTASKASDAVIDDAEALWPHVCALFFSNPSDPEFARSTIRATKTYVSTGLLPGAAGGAVEKQEDRNAVARSTIRCAQALVSLRVRSAAPESAKLRSEARAYQDALRAAVLADGAQAAS